MEGWGLYLPPNPPRLREGVNTVLAGVARTRERMSLTAWGAGDYCQMLRIVQFSFHRLSGLHEFSSREKAQTV
jgi:hypothetical protein